MLAERHCCELLNGTCGRLAVTTVADVRVCRSHAKRLREMIARKPCPDCGLNPRGPRGGACGPCQRKRHNEQRREEMRAKRRQARAA